MPQWDFLNFISTHARHCASFRLRMEAEVTDLLFENERIVGVRATTPQGELEVRADLVVGADGRIRRCANALGVSTSWLTTPVCTNC